MIFLLILCLIGIILIGWKQNEKKFCAPIVLFLFGFLLASIILLTRYNEWEVSTLHKNTVGIIVIGGIIFLISSEFTKKIYLKNNKTSYLFFVSKTPVIIDKWKLYAYLIYEVIVLFTTIIILRQHTGGISFSSMASTYYNMLISGDTAYFPKWIVYSRGIIEAGSYWFAYVISKNIICKQCKPVLEVLIVLVSLFISLTYGSRGGVVDVIIAFSIMFLIQKYEMKSIYTKSYNITLIMKVIMVIIVACIVFCYSSVLLGRSSKGSTLAVYCGAQILNLDSFLQTSETKTEVWGGYTLAALYKWTNRKIGLPSTEYLISYPFRYVNNSSLGNVYTIYYDLVHDFYFIGIFIFVALMACISQLFYMKAKNNNNVEPSISLICYGYISYNLVLSFFAGDFYQHVFSANFLIFIFYWCCFNLFFYNIKFIWGKNE